MSAILQTSSFVDCTVLSTELFNGTIYILCINKRNELYFKEMSYILKK
jgi:hypothetical protein